jgi:FixJ family two-component response regulator
LSANPLICVIDDDLYIQKALVRLVRSFGHSARGFASAEEFIDAGVMDSCTCVVTDIQMPGMSGIELKRAMVERGCLVPVVMVTAHSEPALEQTAHSSGAHCFLKKPIDANALSDCIAGLLKV